MQLFLVRHAEAAAGDPDALRPLTATGRAHARALGERLRDEGVALDALVTSPLLRARQTGDAIARATGVSAEVDDRLAPGVTPDEVRAVAADRGERVLVVAHQPDCSRIAAALTGSPETAFPPGSMVVIEL